MGTCWSLDIGSMTPDLTLEQIYCMLSGFRDS